MTTARIAKPSLFMVVTPRYCWVIAAVAGRRRPVDRHWYAAMVRLVSVAKSPPVRLRSGQAFLAKTGEKWGHPPQYEFRRDDRSSHRSKAAKEPAISSSKVGQTSAEEMERVDHRSSTTAARPYDGSP